MKDYYTLKEIILGLRYEQQDLAEKIKKLEKELYIYGDKNYENINLILADDWDSRDKKRKLSLLLSNKKTLIDSLIDILNFRFSNAFTNPRITSDFVKDNIGYRNFDIKIKEEGQEIINKTIDNILNNPFVNESFNQINFNRRYYNDCLRIAPLATYYIGSKIENKDSLIYDAKADVLTVDNLSRNKNYRDIMGEVLSLRVPKNAFSEYIQNVIDTNDEAKKDIIIPNEKSFKKKTVFYLNEEKDAYVLVKKR